MNRRIPLPILGFGMLLGVACARNKASNTPGAPDREATETGPARTDRRDAVLGDAKQREANPARASSSDKPLNSCDYTFAFWPDGFRREKNASSPDTLCIETGRYGFSLDLADFRSARFGPVKGSSYRSAVSTASESIKSLPSTELTVEIEHGGRTYRARSCLAGRRKDARLTVMLESGRYAQRYRLDGLRFQDAKGKVLHTASSLELTAWPSSMTFLLAAAPGMAYEDGPCPGVVGGARVLRGGTIDIPDEAALDPKEFTLELWVNIPAELAPLNSRHWLVGKNRNEWHEGCFGIMSHRGNATAILNVGGGRASSHSLQKRNALVAPGWHHLAMSYDGDTLRFYVDGKGAGTKRIGRARTPGRDRLRIGGRPDGHGKAINALFDEVRIWKRALSPAEVGAHARTPARYNPNGLSWSMSFDDATIDAAKPPELTGAKVRLSLRGWKSERRVEGDWKFGSKKEFVLHCPTGDRQLGAASVELTATGVGGMKYAVAYEASIGARVIDVTEFKRDWETGYTDIRRYDEVALAVDNRSRTRLHVPVLFDVKKPANITGQVPILCDASGRPTGIPVQLSKNWHHGVYSKFYAVVPAPPGRTSYRLRIAYGFWGSLPSASHAQLSLLGYGGNGRWDQLAIGCWGETMCFDVDNSLTTMMVTDVRMLMARNGATGRKWRWTDGGWGGDWLTVNRSPGDKLFPVELKTAYLAHGPCLTDVNHHGWYGRRRDVAFDTSIATLRTDDYNRVFQRFSYRFTKRLSTEGSHLFKMGPTRNLITPRIAWGNRNGLLKEHEVPSDLRPDSIFKRAELAGPGPWWVAFPGARHDSTMDRGTGSRALVIRSFQASFGGRTYRNPTVTFPVLTANKAKNYAGLNMEMVAPAGVTHFEPGDTIELYVQWITLPRVADDYYGPNKAFIAHMKKNPRSWKTVYREAIGNDLKPSATGGKVVQNYPVVIAAEKETVEVRIAGGVGCVPIRFEGLGSIEGYQLFRNQNGRLTPLDQSVNGNDFWQTDYDAESGSYHMTFNLPLDEVAESTWVLSRTER